MDEGVQEPFPILARILNLFLTDLTPGGPRLVDVESKARTMGSCFHVNTSAAGPDADAEVAAVAAAEGGMGRGCLSLLKFGDGGVRLGGRSIDFID